MENATDALSSMGNRRVLTLTGSADHRLGMAGRCWSITTTFFMSSKDGSDGTTSQKGGL